jgi:hypothetical protein
MKLLPLNKIVSIIGVVLLLVAVYFRENILLQINSLLENDIYNYSLGFSFSSYIKQLSKADLYKWKWIISLSFTFFIAIMTIFSLHFWFKNKTTTKLILKIYLLVFSLICFIGVGGYLFNQFNEVYPFLRRMIGVIHSPIPFILLFILIYSSNKSKG